MIRWEFINMGNFRQSITVEKMTLEADTHIKLIVLQGFVVSQARWKPVTNIITWVHCL